MADNPRTGRCCVATVGIGTVKVNHLRGIDWNIIFSVGVSCTTLVVVMTDRALIAHI